MRGLRTGLEELGPSFEMEEAGGLCKQEEDECKHGGFTPIK